MAGAPGADGREVEGFGALAQNLGAGAVLATLWPVADESTGLFMQSFYALRAGSPELSKAEALRQVQLQLERLGGLPGRERQRRDAPAGRRRACQL